MTNAPTYEYDVFISYNRNDEAWAKQLATRLEREHWHDRNLKVFFAPWDIKPGDSIPERIEYALPRSRKVCLIMSPESADSGWVKIERYITHHFDITERQTRLIPLYRRACEIAPFLQHINRIHFQDDAKFEDGYRVLLATIKDEPLPRGEKEQASLIAVHALIPRPPIVGFVVRRDSEGRDIVARLKEELAPNKNQLIVLSGPGGVGKTTLAAEATRALTEAFGERIVWISALGRDDFALSTLLDEIATQLGEAGMRTLAPAVKTEGVQALIASAPTLIVLDNFETIAPAEETRCVNFLLNSATCPALITTRQKIPSARNIVIPVMSPDEADTFLQLLIEQASDPSAFAQVDRGLIIKASDRNPLVLQWVVAQIDLAQETHTVLDELAHGASDAAQRVFDRSFALPQLGDDGRATLFALSLFAPDASRSALAAVAGFGEDEKRLNEAIRCLSTLWLLKRTASGSRLIVEGLTRQLAKARLERDGDADAFRRRFVAYFLSYASAHAEPSPDNFDALAQEKDNVLGAMDGAFGLQDWAGVARLMDAISFDGVNGYLSIRGHWDEAIRKGEQTLRAVRNLSDEAQTVRFSHNLAISYQRCGELVQARRLYHESLEVEKRLGDQRGIASTLHQLGRLAQGEGELAEARRLYQESLEISKRLGNQSGIAITLHQLGRLAQDEGELPEARHLYQESLDISKRLGNQSGIALTLHQMAVLAQEEGELAEARQRYQESLDISKRLGNQSGVASTLHELGRLAQGEGKLGEARRLYQESLEINKRLGNQSGIAITVGQLGRLTEDEGNYEEAARLFEEALVIFEKLKSPNAEIARRSLERVKGKLS